MCEDVRHRNTGRSRPFAVKAGHRASHQNQMRALPPREARPETRSTIRTPPAGRPESAPRVAALGFGPSDDSRSPGRQAPVRSSWSARGRSKGIVSQPSVAECRPAGRMHGCHQPTSVVALCSWSSPGFLRGGFECSWRKRFPRARVCRAREVAVSLWQAIPRHGRPIPQQRQPGHATRRHSRMPTLLAPSPLSTAPRVRPPGFSTRRPGSRREPGR